MGAFFDKFRGLHKLLLICPLLLAIISITMMVSTSYDNGIVISREVLIQSISYMLGLGLIIVIVNIDHSVFRDYIKWLYIGSIVLLLLVYVPGLGVEHFGAKSWINLGFMDVQPSEIVKITFMIIFADYLTKHHKELHSFYGLGKAVLYCAPFILIVVKEDLGSALVFMSIWLVMIFYAGLDHKILAKCAAAVIVMIPFAYKIMAAHQKVRIDAWLHPSNLSLEGNYQVYQSKIAIGSGGWLGKGLFHGTQKGLEFLPVRNSDFIYAVICEEFGFVGGFAVIAIYALFIYSIAKVAQNSKDQFGSFIVMGVLGMLAFQIFENIAMTMGLMPVTGITLPFLSYGGSAIISNMISLGLVINIAIRNKSIQF